MKEIINIGKAPLVNNLFKNNLRFARNRYDDLLFVIKK